MILYLRSRRSRTRIIRSWSRCLAVKHVWSSGNPRTGPRPYPPHIALHASTMWYQRPQGSSKFEAAHPPQPRAHSSRTQVKRVWSSLPHDAVREVHQLLAKACMAPHPLFGPADGWDDVRNPPMERTEDRFGLHIGPLRAVSTVE